MTCRRCNGTGVRDFDPRVSSAHGGKCSLCRGSGIQPGAEASAAPEFIAGRRLTLEQIQAVRDEAALGRDKTVPAPVARMMVHLCEELLEARGELERALQSQARG